MFLWQGADWHFPGENTKTYAKKEKRAKEKR